jgi:hypothetical protein
MLLSEITDKTRLLKACYETPRELGGHGDQYEKQSAF